MTPDEAGDDEPDPDVVDDEGVDERAEIPADPPGCGVPLSEAFRLPPHVPSRANRIFEQLRFAGPTLNLVPRLQDQVRQLSRLHTPALDTMLEQVRQQVSAPLFHSPQWQQLLVTMREMTDGLLRCWPSNWDDISAHDIETALTIARDEGLPPVWVPRSEIVALMFAAPDATARRALLEEHAERIIDDCGKVVDAVDQPPLRDHAAKISEAVVAFEEKMWFAGQALAAVVITSLLQWVYGHGELKKVRSSSMRAKTTEEQLLRDLRVSVLFEAAVPAVKGGMDRLRDDELPETFNRHATLHRVAPQAYTRSSAMSSLVLATGLLAEAQQLLEDGRLTA